MGMRLEYWLINPIGPVTIYRKNMSYIIEFIHKLKVIEIVTKIIKFCYCHHK